LSFLIRFVGFLGMAERNNRLYPAPQTTPRADNVRSDVRPYVAVDDDADDDDRELAATAAGIATRNLRPYGIGDNTANYRRWLEGSAVYRELIFQHVNITPFVGPVVIDPRAAAAIYFYSNGRLLDQAMNIPGLETVLTCAEFLMPLINNRFLTPEIESRRILARAVQALLRNPRRIGQEIRNVAICWGNAVAPQAEAGHYPLADLWGQVAEQSPFAAHGGTPKGFPPEEGRIVTLTPEEAMIYLLFLASHYPNRALPVELLATVYVSCAKQGQISNSFADKITRGVEDETGYEIQIDADVVRVLYQHFGKDFTEVTAPLALNRWNEMLPKSALLLRLTKNEWIFLPDFRLFPLQRHNAVVWHIEHMIGYLHGNLSITW
jgi:hypothetical protein